MLGNVLVVARRIAAGNRWLVIAFAVLAGLWALEWLGSNAIDLMVKVRTANLTIEEAKGRAEKAKAEGDADARPSPDTGIGRLPKTDLFGSPLKATKEQ